MEDKIKEEFNLSEKAEVLMDFKAMIKKEDFKPDSEGFGFFYPEDKLKEFIRRLKEETEQIQMDCATLDICDKEEVNKIIDKLAGAELTNGR